MAVYRRTNRNRYVIAVLVLAALTLVTVDARSNGSGVLTETRQKISDAFSPLQRATHAALRPIGNFLTGAVDYGSLRAENQRLRQEIATLETQGVAGQAAEQEAQQIIAQADLPFAQALPKVVAQIIDNGDSNFNISVTIDKGIDAGIAPGQPVVASGGLVGSVVEAGAHSATVRLVTDPGFVVGVDLPGGNVGAATGEGRTVGLHVTVETPNQAVPQLKVGQAVSTSGLDNERFPPGIPVGRVSRAVTPPGAAEPDIELAPLADLGRLSVLTVLLWSPPS